MYFQWADRQQQTCAAAWWTTWQKTVSPAASELLAPGRTNAVTQTELLLKHAATQVSSCGMCEELLLEMESDYKQGCRRGDQIDELLCFVAELQEEVSRLRIIWKSEREIDQWSCTLPSIEAKSAWPLQRHILDMVDEVHNEKEEEPAQAALPRSERQSPCKKNPHWDQHREETVSRYGHWQFPPMRNGSTHLQAGLPFQESLLSPKGPN